MLVFSTKAAPFKIGRALFLAVLLAEAYHSGYFSAASSSRYKSLPVYGPDNYDLIRQHGTRDGSRLHSQVLNGADPEGNGVDVMPGYGNASQVAIVIVSDTSYAHLYAVQLQTVKCYAARHGYKFALLDPAIVAPLCAKRHLDFFFRKHCTIRHYLARQPQRSVVVVLDADVVGGVSNLSLARWIDAADFDIAFYERLWNFEIMAGNYLVRHTKFALKFLQMWANYEYVSPSGFRSSDNGAIHLAVLDALGIRGRHVCYGLYRHLKDGPDNTIFIHTTDLFHALERCLALRELSTCSRRRLPEQINRSWQR